MEKTIDMKGFRKAHRAAKKRGDARSLRAAARTEVKVLGTPVGKLAKITKR